MDVSGIMDSLRYRAPWQKVARVILKNQGFHVGQGWDDTLPDIDALHAVGAADAAKLEDALIEHLIAGEKSLQFYSASRENLDWLLATARKSSPSKHELVSIFPGILPEPALAVMGDVPPKFCKIIDTDIGSALIFVASRAYQKRVKLSPDSIKASVAGDLEFDSIIGIINHRAVVYDAIWIPADAEFAVVLADYPTDVTTDFPVPSHLALRKFLSKQLKEDVEASNLFESVATLYGAPDGDLVELGFITDDDSVKHLKARQGKKSLRKDSYHSAGSKEVGESLQPFRVAVRWGRKLSSGLTSHPELLLPGTSRHIFGVNHLLTEAVFRNGLNLGDLGLIISKLAANI